MGIKQMIITSLFLPFGLIFCLQFERINLTHMIPQLGRQIQQVVGGLPCANKNAGMVALPSVQHGVVHTPTNFLSSPTNFVHLNNIGVSPYSKPTYNSLASVYSRNLLKSQNTLPASLYAPKKNIATILGTQVQLQSPYSVASRPRSLSPLMVQQTAPKINMVLATPSSVSNVRYGAVEIPISASLLAAPHAVLYAALNQVNQATPKSAQEEFREIRLGEKGYNFYSLFNKDQKEIKPVNEDIDEDIDEDFEEENLDLTILEDSKDKTQYQKRKAKKA